MASLQKIKDSHIKIVNQIGAGTFGDVFEGIYQAPDQLPMNVAIKKLRLNASESERCDFVKEAVCLSHLENPNIIRCYGICVEKDYSLKYLVLEYMSAGDLLSYLRKIELVKPLEYDQIVGVCFDIASGCEHLERRHIIHRDIAARNCLVSIDCNALLKVKLGDLGLARETYSADYYKRTDDNKPLPIRWMSPESILDGLFSTKSDVWSYGVVIWEILSHGKRPYAQLDNKQAHDFITSGHFLEIQEDWPSEMQTLMRECWVLDPKARVSFKRIVEELSNVYKRILHKFDKGTTCCGVDVVSDDSIHEQTACNQPNEHSDLLSLKKSDTSVCASPNLIFPEKKALERLKSTDSGLSLDDRESIRT